MITMPNTSLEWEVYNNIREVEDPEIGITLVELGLIYQITVEEKKQS